MDATETLVKKMLAAKTPIAVWVGPSGARAASGGFYLLIAADVAAMAPGTRTGAAAVVFGMGKSEDGDVLLKKATNDLAALARSIAEHRGPQRRGVRQGRHLRRVVHRRRGREGRASSISSPRTATISSGSSTAAR